MTMFLIGVLAGGALMALLCEAGAYARLRAGLLAAAAVAAAVWSWGRALIARLLT